jgi:hypothetical protein
VHLVHLEAAVAAARLLARLFTVVGLALLDGVVHLVGAAEDVVDTHPANHDSNTSLSSGIHIHLWQEALSSNGEVAYMSKSFVRMSMSVARVPSSPDCIVSAWLAPAEPAAPLLA